MNPAILEALEAAANTFSKYALHHAEKGHTEKAEANHRLAVQMHHAIAAFPVVTESAQQVLDALEAEGFVEYGVLLHIPVTGEPNDNLAIPKVCAVVNLHGEAFLTELHLVNCDENEHTGA